MPPSWSARTSYARCWAARKTASPAPSNSTSRARSKCCAMSAPRRRTHNLKIAIENHAGDMQAHELKQLIEEAGKDFVGACLDSGNPLWTLEDPHVTLETLHPYVLTSHVRDSAVWRVPEGAAVAWVRMGEGNVGIDEYCRKYAELCPGRALSMESIVTDPRVFAFRDPKFWEAYRDVPAWEFTRFLEIADRGKPRAADPRPANQEAARQREREDLEASIDYTRKLLGLVRRRIAMNRRQFIRTGAAGLGAAAFAFGQAGSSKPLRVGLIGCGWYGKCRSLPPDPGVARRGGLALRRGSAHALRSRGHGRVAPGLAQEAAHLQRLPQDARGEGSRYRPDRHARPLARAAHDRGRQSRRSMSIARSRSAWTWWKARPCSPPRANTSASCRSARSGAARRT